MTDLHDAVGELVRQQVRRVHYLPGDPDAHYTARAPCLLAQLQAAVAASSNGGGGRTTPASRLPLAADALDLWVEITANVHGWADLLHIDRRPYRAAERVQFEREERLPGWLRRLWQWTGPAGEMLAPLPVLPPAIHRLAVEDHDPLTDRTVPPVGQLLRAVAARAATLAVDEVTDRIAYKAHSWADRIRTMLGGVQADDHIYPIRGAHCPACGATAVAEARDGERYQVPAVQVRFMPLDGGEADDLWAYRMCVACGDNGWVDYTSATPVTSLDTPPSEAA